MAAGGNPRSQAPVQPGTVEGEARAFTPTHNPKVEAGGRTFTLGPLSARQSFALDRMMGRMAGAAAITGGFDVLAGMRVEDKLDLVALILNPKGEIDGDATLTREWVEEHMRPVEQIRVLGTWLKREDVREYLGEASALLGTMKNATQGAPSPNGDASASPASAE